MDRALGWVVLVAALGAIGGQEAAAQTPRATGPIVVVVESTDPAIRPASFRRELADALDVPVRALGAGAGERSLVLVQVSPDGPAQIRIQRPNQPPRRTTVARGSGTWLARGVLDAMGRASLVTWEGVARPPTGPRLAEWEEPEAAVESGAALDPPPR
jgi:hypothetical protein